MLRNSVKASHDPSPAQLRSTHRRVTLCALSVLGLAAFGQRTSPPAFEVASVRAIDHIAGQRYGLEEITVHPGSLSMRNVRLRACIKWAYDVKDYQITGPEWLGAPGWMGAGVDRYNVLGKARDQAPISELRLMLRSLLADRLQLKLHQESRTMRVLALELAKGPHRLHATDDQTAAEAQMYQNSRGLGWRHASVQEFADFISGPLRTPVLDHTGLKGRFDFQLSDGTQSKQSVNPADREALVIDQIRDELGLKMQAQKAPIDVLVIDHIEKLPAEN